MKLQIPNKRNLISLNFEYIDRTIDQYYRPIQGYFMRKRLSLALDLLSSSPQKKVGRLLDVGYGGGTFMPSLAKLTKKLYGIDLHSKMNIVKKILSKERIQAILSKDSIFKTKFRSGFFDKIVCVSVMEHFRDKELDIACKEFNRLLVPGGFVVIGFPTKNIVSNFIIEYILKFKPEDIHPSGHKEIFSALGKYFDSMTVVSYPSFLPHSLGLYVVVKAYKKK